MTYKDVADELGAEVLCDSEGLLDTELTTACSNDLMSDVLAQPGSVDLLITGLTTVQAVRTSSVASIDCVVIVRGKSVNKDMIDAASDEGIILMVTENTLFEASGLLYAKGLRPGLAKS